MNVLPLSAMGTMTEEELRSAECSDRLYVPSTVFQEHLRTTTVFLKLTNRVEQTVIGCMFAVHSNIGDTAIYVPQWLFEKLDFDTEHITLERVELLTCTQVTLQPFVPIEGLTMEYLQESMEQYSSITDGQTLRLWHPEGYDYEIMVQSVEPAATVSISNCDIPLSMMQPMCGVEEEPPINTVVDVSDTVVSEVAPVPETHLPVTEAPETHLPVTEAQPAIVTETVRERIYKAAMARLEQSKQKED